MTILQLKYVIAIASSKSLREAASRLFVSQPALSSTIRELEEEIGITLFERNNKGISLTDEGKEAWAYLAELAKIGAYPEAIKDASSWDTTYAPFLQGKCAFLFCGDWAVWSLMDSDVDYGIAPMPAGKQPATLMGGYTLSINKNTKNYDAAWAYVEWLTAAEQNYVLQGYGRISARQDGDTASIIADSPHEEQFIAQLDSTYPRPAIINQAELDEMVSEAYRQVILGADPDQTLADLDANVTAFLEEFYG